jgi:hypothetical protein
MEEARSPTNADINIDRRATTPHYIDRSSGCRSASEVRLQLKGEKQPADIEELRLQLTAEEFEEFMALLDRPVDPAIFDRARQVLASLPLDPA